MSIAGMPHPMLSAPRMAGMPHMGGIAHPPKTGFNGGIRGFAGGGFIDDLLNGVGMEIPGVSTGSILGDSLRTISMGFLADGGEVQHRDAGGAMGSGVGGVAPTTQDQNPQMQGVIQRYASLPTEKLQELSQRMQGTPYAPIIQKILQQKQTQPPSSQIAPQTSIAAPRAGGIAGNPAPAPMPQARGGATQRRATGGMSSGDVPSWTKADASQISGGGSGFLQGSTMGRADAVDTTAPAGAYVLPADVVSGLGAGNSLAGARAVEEMLRTGPWGSTLPAQRRGSGPPRPPSIRQEDSKGGGVKGGGNVPVLLSHGEYVISVPHVVAIGHYYLKKHAKEAGKKGALFTAQQSLKAGHKVLDAFILEQRKQHIKKLKSLPGPVKVAA